MVRLGLSIKEFKALNIIELNALYEEYQDKTKEELKIKRLLTAHICNSSGMLKKAVKPEELLFLPEDKKREFTTEQLKELNTWRARNIK